MDQDNMMLYNWTCLPSRICGLRYIPTVEPKFSDCDQRMFAKIGTSIGLPLCIKNNTGGYSALVHSGPSVRKSHTTLITSIMSQKIMSILEIGINVYHPPLLSTTRAILQTKQADCIYLGIDVNDKSNIGDQKKRIHTMTIDSNSRNAIRRRMLELEMSTIDLLVIDGDHSVDMTINDWCFTEFLSPFGTVIIHDTNVHIGPKSVFDAIDATSFSKRLIGTEMKNGKFSDYGMGIARRLF